MTGELIGRGVRLLALWIFVGCGVALMASLAPTQDRTRGENRTSGQDRAPGGDRAPTQGRARGEERPPGETRASDEGRLERLRQELARYPGAERGQVVELADAILHGQFRGHAFYVLRFRQYPVAQVPPAPLHPSNLFAVKPDGAVERLADRHALERFSRAALPPVTTVAQARAALEAWLRLAQELHQDGFIRFAVPQEAVTVSSTAAGGLQVSGKAVVDPRGGDAGEIVATLEFDRAGTLIAGSHVADVRAGTRPICQATRLLDPDAGVRAEAERALLDMGDAAREYLEEQRERADPELRRAIDGIIERILREEP